MNEYNADIYNIKVDDTQLVLGFKTKRQYNNDNKFAYFVNKTPIHLGTLITVANCGQLSYFLAEVFNTISNQIICNNRSYTNPLQSCLHLIPLFETQV